MEVSDLQQLIKEAMIIKRDTGDSSCYSVYKNILDKSQKIAKERMVEVNEDIIVEATNKEVKQLNDTMSYINKDTDQDMYDAYTKYIDIASKLLPKMASEEEMMSYLTDNNINKDMGSCMKALRNNFGNKLDNKLASICSKNYTMI